MVLNLLFGSQSWVFLMVRTGSYPARVLPSMASDAAVAGKIDRASVVRQWVELCKAHLLQE